MAKVSKRGGFSDRNAIKPENTEIQFKSIDNRTRTQLQNMLADLYAWVYGRDLYYGRNYIQDFLKYVKGTIYAEVIDHRKTYDDSEIINTVNISIANDEYDDVLTLIEAIIQYWDEYLKRHLGPGYYNQNDSKYGKKNIFDIANKYFEREYLGYRFVGGIIVPISDELEISEINRALENKYLPVREHITKASKLLADRNNPDYENSIKESISAVEAMCEIITESKGASATLSKMLGKLEDSGVHIHGSLKEAFAKLYGYTNDANGIRHAGGIDGPESSFEEAKFMLVSCSAFVNYLVGVISKL